MAAAKKEKIGRIDLERMIEIEASGDQRWQVYLAAKEYAKQGMYVLPLRQNSKFLPEQKYGITYGSASRTTATIEKWFHPTEGKYAGWNIGIATGRKGGVFVIDVDRHGKKDGFVSLDKLESKNSKLVAPTQATPNGGMHLIFLWQENALSSTNKIGEGIDTRGGTEDACKGHIVAFPSVINNKKYMWTDGGEVEDVPKWIMERMGVSWRPNRIVDGKGGRGNENVSDEDVEQEVPVDQLERMLKYIDPDELSYDEWLRVGQAINTQHPDDKGLEIWDNWSKGGSRYKPNECKIRWKGFEPSGPIRMGSLFYYAKEAGWEPQKGDIKKVGHFDEIVEKINKIHAIVVVGGKVKVLREKTKIDDPILGHYELLGVNDFKSLMHNEVVFVEDDKGKTKAVRIVDIWMGHEGRRTYHNGMGLFPNGKVPEGYYNTWNGFSVEPREGNCKLLLTHVKEVICSSNDFHYEWLMDWCADAVQDPSNPKGTAVVLRGDEGAGKGTLANTVGRLFGSHYRHLIDDSHLLSNFNAHMIDALFTFADEITWGGNKKTSGKLKGIVTEEYLIGERKGVDAVGYRNMNHIFIASNSDWVVPAGTNSRRWFILDVPNDKVFDRSYFDDLNSELSNGGIEAFLYFLLNRKVTNDLRRAPETRILKDQRMRSAASDSVLQWWVRSVENEMLSVPEAVVDNPDDMGDWPNVVLKKDLYDEYERWTIERRMIPEQINIFYSRMLDFKFERTRKTIQGVKKQVYKVPSLKEAQVHLEDKYGIEYYEGESNDN